MRSYKEKNKRSVEHTNKPLGSDTMKMPRIKSGEQKAMMNNEKDERALNRREMPLGFWKPSILCFHSM